MITGLHHFGFRVESLEESIKFYEKIGYSVMKRFGGSSRGFQAVMMKKGKSHVELFTFVDPNSELSKKISRHFAFSSDNLEEDIKSYTNSGY